MRKDFILYFLYFMVITNKIDIKKNCILYILKILWACVLGIRDKSC